MLTREPPTFQGKIKLKVRKSCPGVSGRIEERERERVTLPWTKAYAPSPPHCDPAWLPAPQSAPSSTCWGCSEHRTACRCLRANGRGCCLSGKVIIFVGMWSGLASLCLGKVITVPSLQPCFREIHKILSLASAFRLSAWTCPLWSSWPWWSPNPSPPKLL